VLVVDRHALQPVNFLDLIDQVLLEFLGTTDVQDFMGVHRTFGKLLAFLYVIALEHNHMFAERNKMLLLHPGLQVFDDDATLAANAGTEVHNALNLGNLGGIFRPPGFKELGHARQSARDVPGLRGLARGLGHQGARDDLVAFRDDNVGPGRNQIISDRLAPVIANNDLRVQILLVLDNHHGLLAGGFVRFLLHCDPLDDVMEFDAAGFLRKNRHVVGIPLDEGLALLDLAPVPDRNDRPDHHGVLFQLASVVIKDGDRAILVKDNIAAVFQGHQAQLVVTQDAIMLGFDLGHLENLGSGAADMERAHGELGARLPDGLRRDNAGRFAQLHPHARGQIAAVAIDADPMLAFASQHRADFNPFHACRLNLLGLDFVNFLVRLDEQFLRLLRVGMIVAGEAPGQAFA